VRPTERFAGASDFRFLVDDVGEAAALEILGVSPGTFALWLSGDAEAPQMACMALYAWSSWYLQRVDLDWKRTVHQLHEQVAGLRRLVREAQQAVAAATVSVDYGASNDCAFASLERYAMVEPALPPASRG
jgi:hypothetical protein